MVTNLPLTFGGSSQAHRAHCEDPGESLAHPAHCFPDARASKTGLPMNGGLWPLRACAMSASSLLPQPMAWSDVSDQDRHRDGCLVGGLPLFLIGNPPPLPATKGKPFLTDTRKGVVHLGHLQRCCVPSTNDVRHVRPGPIQSVSPPQGQLAQRLAARAREISLPPHTVTPPNQTLSTTQNKRTIPGPTRVESVTLTRLSKEPLLISKATPVPHPQ